MTKYIGYKKLKITQEHVDAVKHLQEQREHFDWLCQQTKEINAWFGLSTRTVMKYTNNEIIPFRFSKYMFVFDIGETFSYPPEIMYKDYVEEVIKYIPANVGQEVEIALEYAKVAEDLRKDYIEGRLEL